MEPTAPTVTAAPKPAVRSFSIEEALKAGWNVTKSNLFSLIGAIAIVALVNWGSGIINYVVAYIIPDDLGMLKGLVSLVITLVMWFVGIAVEIGMLNYTIKWVDGQKPVLGELFSYFDVMQVLKFFVASLMYGLLVGVGFILLVVPGVIFLVRFSYFTYLIADKNIGPVDALMRSWEMTRGNTLMLIGLFLVLIIINVVGALLLLIGLLVTLPLSMVSAAYVYRKLSL